MTNLRAVAYEILRSGAVAPLREVAPAAERHGLSDPDRGLLRALVGTELRRRGTLRALVRNLAHRQPKPELSTHLHIGLVQLLFLDRVPDHAAVSETVDAVRYTIAPAKATLANAILREAIRRRVEGTTGDPRSDLVGRPHSWSEPLFRDPREHPYLWAEDALSLPSALARRWTKRHGEEQTRAIARTFLFEPPLTVRVVPDPERPDWNRDAALAALAEGDLQAHAGAHPDVLRLPSEAIGRLTATEPFRAGRLTVQGEAALRAAELAEVREGESVLDLCAAPGGKTMVFAGAGARVTAVDRDGPRLAMLTENATRLGVADRIETLAADAAGDLPELGDRTFDLVFVDAPCTNTGTLGAHPAARWRFGPKTLRDLVALQESLLRAGARRVRPGGRLVWSTCSLEPEENEQLLRRFLADDPAWTEDARRESYPADPALPDDQWLRDGGLAYRLRRAP